jgi:hypothetical protein
MRFALGIAATQILFFTALCMVILITSGINVRKLFGHAVWFLYMQPATVYFMFYFTLPWTSQFSFCRIPWKLTKLAQHCTGKLSSEQHSRFLGRLRLYFRFFLALALLSSSFCLDQLVDVAYICIFPVALQIFLWIPAWIRVARILQSGLHGSPVTA